MDHFGPAEEDRTLYHMRELADVPRPWIAQERGLRLRREARDWASIPLGEASEKMLRQQESVLTSLPQGGQRNGHDCEAKIQILPKRPRNHCLLEVVIRDR